MIFFFNVWTHLFELSRWLSGEKSACQRRIQEFDLWVGTIPLENEMATDSSIFAWETPWTEELSGYSPWGAKNQTQFSNWTPPQAFNQYPRLQFGASNALTRDQTQVACIGNVESYPGVLRFMGSQRVGHDYDWATELNWTDPLDQQGSPQNLCIVTLELVNYTVLFTLLLLSSLLCSRVFASS